LDLSAASHLRRGVELSQAGRPQDAIAEHEKALRLDPELVQAHANLIALYGRLGMFDKGEEHYRAVLALNPNQFPNAHYDYGVLLLERHRYDEAEQAFRRALQINPHYAKARYNLGVILETKSRFQEALEQFEKALEDQPAYREAHFQIGRILVNEKKFDGAIQHFLQILDPVNSETSTYLYALGAAYARAGNRESALHYLELAREQAAARGQSKLLADIERDLKALNVSRTKPE
jgi:tetratricopeptide (TPR) repeat protein